jgi:hypothetical protein
MVETVLWDGDLLAADSDALRRVCGALSRHRGQLRLALGQPESNEGQESGISRQRDKARDNWDHLGDDCPVPSDNGDEYWGDRDMSMDNWKAFADNCT